MIETIELHNSVRMPIIGFGTYGIPNEKLRQSLFTALLNECRLFDTAHCYCNEGFLGDELDYIFKNTNYNRSDVFLTTKIGDKLDRNGFPQGAYFYNSNSCLNRNHKEIVYSQVYESLKNLRTDYIDLLLIHWPYNDCLEEIWTTMELLLKKGIVRAIGVSNCKNRHINRIMDNCIIKPMVNQIFYSPINTQKETYEYCKEHKIQLESYSPMMCLIKDEHLKSSEIISSLSRKYKKTPAQIILRWNIDKGVIPIPKSSNNSRIHLNYDVFDFKLSSAEVKSIDTFNVNYQYLPESRYCPGY